MVRRGDEKGHGNTGRVRRQKLLGLLPSGKPNVDRSKLYEAESFGLVRSLFTCE